MEGSVVEEISLGGIEEEDPVSPMEDGERSNGSGEAGTTGINEEEEVQLEVTVESMLQELYLAQQQVGQLTEKLEATEKELKTLKKDHEWAKETIVYLTKTVEERTAEKEMVEARFQKFYLKTMYLYQDFMKMGDVQADLKLLRLQYMLEGRAIKQMTMQEELNFAREKMAKLLEQVEKLNDKQNKTPVEAEMQEKEQMAARALVSLVQGTETSGDDSFSNEDSEVSELANDGEIEAKEETPQPLFICGECGEAFVIETALSRHVKIPHSPTGPWSSPVELTGETTIATEENSKEGPDGAKTSNPPRASLTSCSDSDDDIMIIESPTTSTTSPLSNRRGLSGVASSFVKYVPVITALPILSPVSTENESAAVVPLKVIPKKPHPSFTGKRQFRDITKRHHGFYCICGIKFNSRRRLDAHVNFHNTSKTNKAEGSASVVIPKSTPPTAGKEGRISSKSHGVAQRRFLCHFCFKLFVTRAAFSNHLRFNHPKIRNPKAQIRFPRNRISQTNEETTSSSSSRSLEAVPLASTDSTPSPPQKPIKSPPPHRRDLSKSRLGHFCTCGLEFRARYRLINHTRRANQEHKQQTEEGVDQDARKNPLNYKCMTCSPNQARIHHRVQAHGHGLS